MSLNSNIQTHKNPMYLIHELQQFIPKIKAGAIKAQENQISNESAIFYIIIYLKC